MSSTLLTMSGIEKSFGSNKVLKGVNFDLMPGEVHALMGENGAGKSTLMKILTGIHKRNAGTVAYLGEQKEYTDPKESQLDGIAIVHQELNMMKDLTVAENIYIGREEVNKGFINDRAAIEKTEELFERLKVNISPTEKVDHLTVGQQQMVEIAKAISMDAKLIVFDEPTAALTEKEINELFKIIEDLRKKGIGIIYISHRMNEIKKITDRITVLRDGEYIGTVLTKEVTKDEIINMMVGRSLSEDPKQTSNVSPNAEEVLKVVGLKVGKTVKDVSFNLKKGEIVGFSGLMGAGRTEVARAIFGADKRDQGDIYINGKQVNIRNTHDAVKHGIGYLSEDRRRYGLVTGFSIADNVVMSALSNYSSNGIIQDQKVYHESEKYRKKMKVKSTSSSQIVRSLSGGNQQKVVIAKWLVRDSDIIIFDEPTRGIDVGAKSEIYDLMNELVNQGKSIIMISSELTEILRMSDRVIVMCEGRITGELPIENATQEKIMELATDRKEM